MKPAKEFPAPAISKTRHDFADYWECIGEMVDFGNYCSHFFESWSYTNEDESKEIECYDL